MIRECRVYRGAAKISGSAAGGIVRGNPPQENKRAVKSARHTPRAEIYGKNNVRESRQRSPSVLHSSKALAMTLSMS